jgi:hypothetical protein
MVITSTLTKDDFFRSYINLLPKNLSYCIIYDVIGRQEEFTIEEANKAVERIMEIYRLKNKERTEVLS